jgi:hypothetical protein
MSRSGDAVDAFPQEVGVPDVTRLLRDEVDIGLLSATSDPLMR